MTKGRDITNLPASIHDRLLALARQQGIQYQEALQYFAMERFLYRLSRSKHTDEFVLKGALMLRVWQIPQSRLTRDIDLLGFITNTAERITEIMREVSQTPVLDDGLLFVVDSIKSETIRDRSDYVGIRARFLAKLGRSVLPMQIDIGFADAVTPPAEYIEYPVLLDFPKPRLRAYPRETTIAEKFHAMVELGQDNTRMKDFFDLWQLSRTFEFDGDALSTAIRATFHRRATPYGVGLPTALTESFGENAGKAVQWQAFIAKNRLQDSAVSWVQIISALRYWLSPVIVALQQNTTLSARWMPDRGWQHA